MRLLTEGHLVNDQRVSLPLPKREEIRNIDYIDLSLSSLYRLKLKQIYLLDDLGCVWRAMGCLRMSRMASEKTGVVGIVYLCYACWIII